MTEERRLAAIMFTDVCGFSRVMGSDESRALAIVQMAVSCIESGAAIYSGRVIKKMGDGMLVEFPSAVNAVRCAVEVQKAVSRHNATAAVRDRFQLRIGIHVGDVVVTGEDIMGDGVNVASRIEPLAEPGGICISRDVFDLVRNKVMLETVRLGPYELKNISRHVEIYRVLTDAMDRPGRTVMQEQAKGRDGALARKVWLIGGIAAAVVAVIAGGGALRKIGFERRAEREFRRVERLAGTHTEQGRPAEALKALQSYPAAFRNTKWQAEVERMASEARRGVDRQRIEQRFAKFLRTVQDDNRDAALQFVDPAILRKVDASALWGVMRLTAFVLKVAQVKADDFRIESIEFSDDSTAVVKARFFAKNREHPEGVWNDIAPGQWRRIEGDWYLRPEAPGAEGDNAKDRPPPRRTPGAGATPPPLAQ